MQGVRQELLSLGGPWLASGRRMMRAEDKIIGRCHCTRLPDGVASAVVARLPLKDGEKRLLTRTEYLPEADRSGHPDRAVQPNHLCRLPEVGDGNTP